MSDSGADPLDRLSSPSKEPDSTCPDSHVDVGLEGRRWMSATGWDAETVWQWQRLQMERPEIHLSLVQSLQDEARRALLTALHERESVTYADVGERTRFGRRTLRRRARAMEDEGLIEVADGRPTVLAFADEGVEALAKHALALWERTW